VKFLYLDRPDTLRRSRLLWYYVWHTRRMNLALRANPNKRHRFAVGIIGHCAWLYFRNNRAENSHQSTRQPERRMERFKSSGHAQGFLAAYGPIAQHFRPRRHCLPARVYRQEMTQRFQAWREVTGTAVAA
jgi:transposase-like protein